MNVLIIKTKELRVNRVLEMYENRFTTKSCFWYNESCIHLYWNIYPRSCSFMRNIELPGQHLEQLEG